MTRTEARVLLTGNRDDFIALHRRDAPHAGICIHTADPDFTALAARIHAALTDSRATGRFLARVNRGGHTFDS